MFQLRDKLLSTSMAMLSCQPPIPLCCLLQSPLPPNKLFSQLCKDMNRAHFQSHIQTLPGYKGSLGTPPEPCISPARPPSLCPSLGAQVFLLKHTTVSSLAIPGPSSWGAALTGSQDLFKSKVGHPQLPPFRRQDPPPALPSASAAVVSQKHVLMHPVILFVLLWVAFTPRTALSV